MTDVGADAALGRVRGGPTARDRDPRHAAGFDGPLGLLLALIEARQLDVLTVPLGALADAYLDALATLDDDRMGNVSAFVAVASQLILIKSRAMLPRHARPRRRAAGRGPGSRGRAARPADPVSRLSRRRGPPPRGPRWRGSGFSTASHGRPGRRRRRGPPARRRAAARPGAARRRARRAGPGRRRRRRRRPRSIRADGHARPSGRTLIRRRSAAPTSSCSRTCCAASATGSSSRSRSSRCSSS